MGAWCSPVNTSPCHGEDRGFESLRTRHRVKRDYQNIRPTLNVGFMYEEGFEPGKGETVRFRLLGVTERSEDERGGSPYREEQSDDVSNPFAPAIRKTSPSGGVFRNMTYERVVCASGMYNTEINNN